MEIIGLLAPIAFVFGLSAIAQATSLKKEVSRLSEKVSELEKHLSG